MVGVAERAAEQTSAVEAELFGVKQGRIDGIEARSFGGEPGRQLNFFEGSPLLTKMEVETRSSDGVVQARGSKFPLLSKDKGTCGWSDGLRGWVNCSCSGVASTIDNQGKFCDLIRLSK